MTSGLDHDNFISDLKVCSFGTFSLGLRDHDNFVLEFIGLSGYKSVLCHFFNPLVWRVSYHMR